MAKLHNANAGKRKGKSVDFFMRDLPKAAINYLRERSYQAQAEKRNRLEAMSPDEKKNYFVRMFGNMGIRANRK